MNLTVYKGFDRIFLESIQEKPLVRGEISTKTNVLQFDNVARKKLAKALLSLDEGDSAWITYEEYSLINKWIEDAIEEDGLKLTIFRNNLYPDCYPIPFPVDPELAAEIIRVINGDTNTNVSEKCQRYLSVYITLSEIDGVYYGSFYNYEFESVGEIPIRDYYPYNIIIEDSQNATDYNLFINEDVDTYLRDLVRIIVKKPKVIGLSSTDGEAAKRIQRSLQAYCKANATNIRGVLKFTSLVNPAQVKAEKEQFVSDYFNPANNGGIAATDQRFEFVPTAQTAYNVPSELTESVNKQICAYLGVSPKIVAGEYTEDEFAAFYESLIEPFAIQMSLEFSRKCGAEIRFTAERLEFSSAATRISLLRELLPFGVVSINEARRLLSLPEVPDGEKRLQSLNYVAADKADAYQLEESEVKQNAEPDADTGV